MGRYLRSHLADGKVAIRDTPKDRQYFLSRGLSLPTPENMNRMGMSENTSDRYGLIECWLHNH